MFATTKSSKSVSAAMSDQMCAFPTFGGVTKDRSRKTDWASI